MSYRKEKKVDLGSRSLDAKAEFYNSVYDMVQELLHRPVRHSQYDMRKKDLDKDWHGVAKYQDALDLLSSGYQPVVDALKEKLNPTAGAGEVPRFSFHNNIVGFAPVVPLALKGVPESMIDMRMTSIKAKVIDIFYDMTANCDKDIDQFIKAGEAILSAIMSLERQGYRFNLYAVQSYTSTSDGGTTDILCIKIKSSGTPLDIKRMSYPLTHPSFFRVIGFDWQGKSPITRYLGSGRGRAIGYDYTEDEIRKLVSEMFGEASCYISCSTLIDNDYDQEKLKEMFTNATPKK